MRRLDACFLVDPSILNQHHGVRRYILTMAAALRCRFRVRILCVLPTNDGGMTYTELFFSARYEKDNGFSTKRLVGTNRRNILDSLVKVLGESSSTQLTSSTYQTFVGDRVSGEFDVLIVGAPWVYSLGMSMPKAHRNYCLAFDAIPIIYSRDRPDDVVLRDFAKLHEDAYRTFCTDYDGLLAISAESKRQCIEALDASNESIQVLPPSLPPGFDQQCLDHSSIERQPSSLVLAAPFDRRKGLLEIPGLVNESGAKSLTIFGGVRCIPEDVGDFFSALEIDDVTWWSSVDFRLQVELYSRASALLFPSLNEGLGLPVLESYACGTCALVTNIAPLNTLVVPEGVLGDREASVRRIKKVLAGPPAQLTLKEQAWNRWRPEILANHVVELI